MFIYNFKIAFRNLVRHKNQCIIGVFGLAIGFSAYILISLFVQYEYSWDKHNEKYNRIYRVQRHFTDVTQSVEGNNISPHTRGITSAALETQFPEIEKVMLLRENRESGLGFIATTPENQFFDENGIVADPSILEIFTYNFIEGTAKNSLKEPFSVVVSKTVANKLFPNASALGQYIILEKKYNLKVTGVYNDLPYNSILRPSFIISMSTLEMGENVRSNIWSGNFMTYVLLKEGVDYNEFNKKLKGLHKDIKGIEKEEIKLCPLSKLHINFNGNEQYLMILWLYSLVGIFILLLTSTNYINLFTALSTSRAKEVAVRKVNGSNRLWLMNLFMYEAAIMAFIAILLAFTITSLFLPAYNSFIGQHLSLSFSQSGMFIVQIFVITLFVGILSGAYPAFIMSSQKIGILLKGSILKRKNEGIGLRKILISFQFVISIFLLVIAIYVSIQIKFLLNKELGVDKENLLICRFETKSAIGDFEQLRSRLMFYPEIKEVTMSKKLPMYQHGGWELNWEGGNPEEKIHFRYNEASFSFVQTMGMQLVDGRNFSQNTLSDSGKVCLINETGCKALGLKEPVGKWIGRNNLRIAGVIKDFHINNVFNKIEPYMVVLHGNELKDDWTYAFRIAPGKLSEAKKILKTEMERTFPNDAFEFHVFSNDFKFQDIFKILESINNTLVFFAVVSVLLTILGLFGLIAFTIQRQTKEISIRKISGAHSYHIFLRIYSEYFKLILIAAAIAWPLAYYVIEAFPGTYKPAQKLWLYGFSVGIVFLVSFFTMLYYTIRASNSNPVESLRYE